jgi:hypothetical protein
VIALFDSKLAPLQLSGDIALINKKHVLKIRASAVEIDRRSL